MFISPTTNIAFQAGNIKLIGFKAEDLSTNFYQVFDLAKRKQMDFSILKRTDKKLGANIDTYSIIASKDIENMPYKIQGISAMQIHKDAGKDYTSLKVLSAILDAMDMINEKLKIKVTF